MRYLLTLAVVAATTLGVTTAARADGTVECTGRETLSRQGDWYLCRDKGPGSATCWHFGVRPTPSDNVTVDTC